MTYADKVVCGCSTCCDADDVITAYNGKRRKISLVADIKLEEMDDNTVDKIISNVEFEVALKDYKLQIFTRDNTHKHKRGWSATDQYGCGEQITICRDHYPAQCPTQCTECKQFPHFRCQKGDCVDYKECGYVALAFETNHVDDDVVITYTLFTPHACCNVHGGHFIQEY